MPRISPVDLHEAEYELNDITAELCTRWGCTPDEICHEDIMREKRKRDREFAKQIKSLEKWMDK